MKRMLINATQPEELRVALVDGQRLYDLDIESTRREQKKSNIYKGKVVRIEPSLEAAFVDYGSTRHGFLPFKEIARALFKKGGEGGRGSIKDQIEVGQEFIVQVEKEERGNKGAALTTFVSLAGRYLVLMPNNPRAGGVSRQIEGDDRSDAREAMSSLEIPQGMGLILRTAGVGKSTEELQWDLNYLLQLWEAIKVSARERSAPFLIYQESDVIIRAIRDYLRNDVSEIWVDDPDAYQRAKEFMQQVMPHNLSKLKLYKEVDPLFNRYQIEGQIESAYAREVKLPSGGSLIIDHTEALTSIDINSARATGGEDIEATALNTNLEAADEVARQLRLRDLGGLIVIDFIDMMNNRNQREVENRLKEALKIDRARVQIGRISRVGLLEMSRQRLRPSLGESSHLPCPRCSGQGTIRGVESISLAVMRILEEEAMKDLTAKVIARVPVKTAAYLLNEKRQPLLEIEQRLDVELIIVPDESMETPHYEVQRIRLSEAGQESYKKASYKMAEARVEEDLERRTSMTPPPQPRETAAVKQVVREQPFPAAVAGKESNGKSMVARFLGALFGLSAEEEAPQAKEKSKPHEDKTSRQRERGTGDKRRRSTSARGGERGEKTGGQQGSGRGSGRRRGGRKSGSSGGGRGRRGQQQGDKTQTDGGSQTTATDKNRDSTRTARGGKRDQRGNASADNRDASTGPEVSMPQDSPVAREQQDKPPQTARPDTPATQEEQQNPSSQPPQQDRTAAETPQEPSREYSPPQSPDSSGQPDWVDRESQQAREHIPAAEQTPEQAPTPSSSETVTQIKTGAESTTETPSTRSSPQPEPAWQDEVDDKRD
jgi:ribonuclease E